MTEAHSGQQPGDSPDMEVDALLEKYRGSAGSADFTATYIDTPPGAMLAIADGSKAYMLHRLVPLINLERRLVTLHRRTDFRLVQGTSRVLDRLADELHRYFAGELRTFGTPIHLTGTDFQNRAFRELASVPYGQTVSYSDIANRIGSPSAFRAVAQAIAQNPLAILVPCHRVINTDGKMGGFASGIDSKEWLLNFERKNLEGQGI